jgi:hypothetical protein
MMNVVKLKKRAEELKEMIESGECETTDKVYTPEERKKIKKRWPLIFDLIQGVEEQLQAALEAQDDLLTQVEVLEVVSEATAIKEAHDMDEAPIEVVEAVPVPEDD